MLWPWPSVHPGQLAPTTLPQCRLVSNPRSAGLSLSLSLAFCSVGFSLPLCRAHSISLYASPSLSLSVCVSPSSPSHGVFSFSSPSPGGFSSFSPSPPFLSVPLSPESQPRLTPLSACWLLSGISPFAWRCAQQRVEETYNVPHYHVRLHEERFLKQPYEISSARQPHVQAVSIFAHRGRHRSVALCRWAVEDCLPLERMPLASTLGSPLNLHVCQSPSLQGPIDVDHHQVEFLIVHPQWFSMVVHNFTVHPCAVRLIQSKPDLLITGSGHSV